MDKSAVIAGRNLLINGHPFYLCGGEVQYFRLPRQVWRDRLQQAIDGGVNTVSSYLPWYWHEAAEGKFDFTGRTCPERHLRAFLDLVAELELKFIARPGPFINSELRWGGFPEWLFRNHPETMSRRGDGRIAPGRPLPAEGEPLYRQYVRNWYARINPFLDGYQIQQGGPIILFQPDNELSAAWSFGLLNSLYDPEILAVHWPAWLRQTYGRLDAVNQRYDQHYRSFQDIPPPCAFPTTPAEKRRCLDWLNFKRRFFADWGAILAQWAQEDGIRVPIIFNEPVAGFYQHGDHSGFGSVLKAQGIEGATACHLYSDRLMDLEGAASAALAVETAKASPWGGPLLCVEMNTCWYMPRLSRTEINWPSLLRLGFGHGLDGFAIYPYAAGQVSPQDVIEAPDYFAGSPLDLAGNRSPGWHELRQFYRFCTAWEPEILASALEPDLLLGFSPACRLLDFLGHEPLLAPAAKTVAVAAAPGGEKFNAEPALDRGAGVTGHDWLDGYENVSKQTVTPESGQWSKLREALLLCCRLNLAAPLLDLVNPNREPGTGWIVVPCTGTLEKSAIDWLLQHLDLGGGVLFFPTIPIRTMDGESDLRLAKRLQITLTDLIRPAGGEVMDYGARFIDFNNADSAGVYGWIFRHRFPRSSQILAEFGKKPVIARLPEKQGRVLVAGTDLRFTSESSVRLWEFIFREGLGLTPVVTVRGNECRALLRQGPAGQFLTVANLHGRAGLSRIVIQKGGKVRKTVRLEVDLAPHEARCLPLGVTLNEGKISLVYSTSELTPRDAKCKVCELRGQAGTAGTLAFSKLVKVRLNGQAVATKPAPGGLHLLRYRHETAPLVLEIG